MLFEQEAPVGFVNHGSTFSEGQAVRAVAYGLFLILLAVSLSGCALFGNKSKSGGSGSLAKSGSGSGTRLADNDPLAVHTPLQEDAAGMLAGYVVDESNTRLPRVYIRCICLDDKVQQTSAPVEIEAQPEGSFLIPSLKRNKRYKLVARARVNGELLAGNAYSTVPNPRIVIKLSEKYVTADTPDIPTPPPNVGIFNLEVPEQPKEEATPSQETDPLLGGKSGNDKQQESVDPLLPKQGVGLEKQTGNNIRPQKQYQPNIARNEFNIRKPPTVFMKPNTLNPKRKERITQPPTPPANWPKQMSPAQEQEERSKVLPQTKGKKAEAKAGDPVPSVVLVGNEIKNLALYDLYGNPWQWKVNKRGKVILIDFWRPSCGPCIRSIPYLNLLQKKYGPYGLEILSIAGADNGSLEEQKKHISRIGYIQQTNYRLLMGNEPGNRVLDFFRVEALPTMWLIGADNRKIMHHVGMPKRNDWQVLENEIRRRLSVPNNVSRVF